MDEFKNSTLEEIKKRKSVRVYTDRPVTREIKNQLLDAAIAAPTAGCMCLYTLLDITDPEIKKQLSVLCDNQPFIAKAPAVFIFLADWQRWYDSFLLVSSGKTRTPAEGDLLLAAADALIAAQNMVVAAESLGLGSCYIGDILERQEDISALLHLPAHAMPVGMLCIGYPATQQKEREKPARFDRRFLVFENIYQTANEETLRSMFASREGHRGDFDKEVPAMRMRKWDSEFMEEMNRSVRVWISRWCRKQEEKG